MTQTRYHADQHEVKLHADEIRSLIFVAQLGLDGDPRPATGDARHNTLNAMKKLRPIIDKRFKTPNETGE
jgi:hypothetical protein